HRQLSRRRAQIHAMHLALRRMSRHAQYTHTQILTAAHTGTHTNTQAQTLSLSLQTHTHTHTDQLVQLWQETSRPSIILYQCSFGSFTNHTPLTHSSTDGLSWLSILWISPHTHTPTHTHTHQHTHTHTHTVSAKNTYAPI